MSKLWDTFVHSTATIFDYARGVFRYTPQQEKQIEEVRQSQKREGVNLPAQTNIDKPEKPS